MLTKLKEHNCKVIGMKQTLKALKGDQVAHLFVAKDAEMKVIRPIIELAQKNNVPIHYARTMVELGLAAGIEVGAAVAAILKEL